MQQYEERNLNKIGHSVTFRKVCGVKYFVTVEIH
jgi:hypothetical protein